MAKTVEDMRRNYANSASFAQTNWEASRSRIVAEWREAMTKLLGQPPGPQVTQKFEAKIAAAQYQMGDPDTFIRRYVAKMTS
jgi:hypothetical protein